jgi:hypothetical protein
MEGAVERIDCEKLMRLARHMDVLDVADYDRANTHKMKKASGRQI